MFDILYVHEIICNFKSKIYFFVYKLLDFTKQRYLKT